MLRQLSIAALAVALNGLLAAQPPTDHWEAVVSANDVWSYLTPSSEPPGSWKSPGFDDSLWPSGPGGIGYGDGDDATVVAPNPSLYMRRVFSIPDTSKLTEALFHADFDDGFVAYLNGMEIARSNVAGSPPAWDDLADTWREAELYTGGIPENYPLSAATVDALIREGSNVLAIQVHNWSLGSSDMSALFWLTAGIADSTDHFDPVPDWFVPPFNSSNLPLLLIETGGVEIPDGVKIDASCRAVDQAPGLRNFLSGPFQYDGLCGISLRGASSLGFAKKGYALELRDVTGGPNNFPLLGLPAEDDWVLHGPFSDKSLLRNALAYQLGQSMSGWSPNTRFCELWIDSEYRGVYLLVEKIVIDDNRLDLAGLQPGDVSGDELSGAYLLQIDRNTGQPDEGWYSSHWPAAHFFVYEDPDGEDLTPVQRSYIRNYVDDFEITLRSGLWLDSLYGYRRYVDLSSFAEFFLHQELANNVDAYRLSSFFYKKRDSNGGKLWMGPVWDYNLGYGNVDYCDENLQTDGWAYNADESCGAPIPFWWDRLLEDERFTQRVRCRWDSLRAGAWSDARVLGSIDSMVLLLGEAAPRNFARWQVLGDYVWPNAFIGASWEDELGYLKGWVEDRLAFMDASLPAYCPVSPTALGIVASDEQQLRVWPNPHYGEVQVRPPSREAVEWSLYDLSGRALARHRIQGSTRIELGEQLPAQVVYRAFDQEGRVVGSGLLFDGR